MGNGKFFEEVRASGLGTGPASPSIVTEADLAGLPPTVRRYMRFMGVEGLPKVWSYRAKMTGSFKMKPDGDWLKIEGWNYDSAVEVARIFHMKIRFAGILPVYVRDTYVRGSGLMSGRMFDLFSIVHGTGMEIDTGELSTYLNDGILSAPSMLLGPRVKWTDVDESSFDVELTDAGRTVKARVYLDSEGAPVNFSTTDRFVSDPYDPKHPMIRAEWTTPVRDWRTVEGRKIPLRGQGVWLLKQGPFAYADFTVDLESVKFNVAPGE